MNCLKRYLRCFYRIQQGCIAEPSANINSWATIKISTNEKYSLVARNDNLRKVQFIDGQYFKD